MHLAAAAPVLDTVAKVRALSPEEALRALPVRIEATVIFIDPESLTLFVRDSTACTYVGTKTPDHFSSMHLEPGTRVRIDGITDLGGFFPNILERQIEVIGKAPLPQPRKISEAELLAPALDSQWVEVPAMVTGVASGGLTFTLTIEVYGRKLTANLPLDEHNAERAAALIQHPVRLQGIAGTAFNNDRQMTGRDFSVPSFDQLIPTDTVASSASTILLRKVNELLRSDDTEQTLVRVGGVVTQVNGTDFYLRDASGSILVCTSGKDAYNVGDRVEAVGFAVIAPYRPRLRAPKVTLIEHSGHPQPMPLDIDLKKLPRFHDELVTLDADFLIRHAGSSDAVLQCRAGDQFFEALLPPGGSLPAGLVAGDHVRLAGICELTTTHPTSNTWFVDGFRLHLPKTGGAIILQHASWWTLEHLLDALRVIIALALAALAWIVLLRRRVKAQTEIIGTQLQREAAHDERQRIARELHDSVEQELTGLSMQLGNIAGDIRRMPTQIPLQFGDSIQIAQKMLQHCQEEAHASIQDLRNIDLEQLELPGALRKLLPMVVDGFGANLQLNVTGDSRSIAGITETHLLRIAQEGVANAAHHAAASKIAVDLGYTSDAVTLTISDDGRGFDPSVPAPDGHFGLRGIRERANKMRAALDIQSTPGKGTTIRVMVPTNNHTIRRKTQLNGSTK
jgi:signal transduction histidine kinase